MSEGTPGTKRVEHEAKRRRRERLPWWLLAGAVGLLGGGGWLAASSLSAQFARVEQLEREATESEERVAELLALRDSMARRMRALEQHAGLGDEKVHREEKGARPARHEAVRAELRKLLKGELQRGEAFLEETEELRVELSDRLLFEPGKATLTPGGEELLTRGGARLGMVEGHLVRVGAHTDGVPEGMTSWELSATRAVAVVHHLESKAKVAPERLVAEGHGAWHPVVSEEGPQARARNRRVELLLLPAPSPPP